MEQLKTITGEYPDWVSVKNIDPHAQLDDSIKVISCDTRDFAIGWQFKNPTVNKKTDYNYEYWVNKGLSKLYSVFRKQNREKWAINKNDIISWLDSLCKASGGYDLDWRYLNAQNVKYCNNWELKYIRFIRNNKNPEEFVVCNAHFFPVEYKQIIENIDKG